MPTGIRNINRCPQKIASRPVDNVSTINLKLTEEYSLSVLHSSSFFALAFNCSDFRLNNVFSQC